MMQRGFPSLGAMGVKRMGVVDNVYCVCEKPWMKAGTSRATSSLNLFSSSIQEFIAATMLFMVELSVCVQGMDPATDRSGAAGAETMDESGDVPGHQFLE